MSGRQVVSHTDLPDTASRDELLWQVAAALGVPVDAFYVMPEQHVFHIGADGTQWILTSDKLGSPMVRCVTLETSDQEFPNETAVTFLSRNLYNPQGKALAALIDQLLTTHLHFGKR
jgi:hypothetical protein